MDFKVGDIVIFSKEKTDFRAYLYDRKHIVTCVKGTTIMTKGHGWNYKTFGSTYDELTTGGEALNFIIKVNQPKSWAENKLKFNFINSDHGTNSW